MSKLQDVLKKEKLIYGTEKTLKLLRNGKVKLIFLANNVKDDVKAEIEHLAKLGNVEVVHLKIPNTEVGVVCKKPFAISVLCY